MGRREARRSPSLVLRKENKTPIELDFEHVLV